MSIWDLPSGWKWKPVAEIAKDTERRNPASTPDEPFRYVDISSVDNEKGSIKIDEVRTIEGANAPSRARKVIQVDDVIFATTRPYLRNIALVSQELNNQICSTGFCVLRAKEGLAEPSYFYYACRSQFFINQLLPKQRGANYPAVSDGDVYDSLIPIPYPDEWERSLAEQRRIVARIEALLAEVREMRKLHDEITNQTNGLMQAVLAELYSEFLEKHEMVETQDVCLSITDGSHTTPPYVPSGVPFLFVKHIVNRFLDFQDTKFVTQSYFDGLSDTRKPEKGDVLLSVVGSYGVPVVVDTDDDFCFQRHIAILKPDPQKIKPQYLRWMLDAPQVLDQMHKVVTGSAQKTLTLTYLRKLSFPCPTSISQQEQAATTLNKIFEEISEMQYLHKEDATRISQLEQTVLAQAFRGEL